MKQKTYFLKIYGSIILLFCDRNMNKWAKNNIFFEKIKKDYTKGAKNDIIS